MLEQDEGRPGHRLSPRSYIIEFHNTSPSLAGGITDDEANKEDLHRIVDSRPVASCDGSVHMPRIRTHVALVKLHLFSRRQVLGAGRCHAMVESDCHGAEANADGNRRHDEVRGCSPGPAQVAHDFLRPRHHYAVVIFEEEAALGCQGRVEGANSGPFVVTAIRDQDSERGPSPLYCQHAHHSL